jgi:hypothetical protein
MSRCSRVTFVPLGRSRSTNASGVRGQPPLTPNRGGAAGVQPALLRAAASVSRSLSRFRFGIRLGLLGLLRLVFFAF